MISCTEFIPAYSALFRELELLGGTDAVEDFWAYLTSMYLTNLHDLVNEHGILGCWLYWRATLNEEAAEFSMELDEDEGVFRIVMHRCPSKALLLETPHITPYDDYCRHCDALYRNVLEPLGYEYRIDLSRTDRAECCIEVRRPAAGSAAARDSSDA